MARAYGLRDTERQVLVAAVNNWLEKEIAGKPLHSIEVVQKVGRSQTAIAVFDLDELEILENGDAVVDQVLEQFGNKGGKFNLRCTWQPESGPGTGGADRKQLNKSFTMTALRTEQRTVSQGASAGIEQLTSSFGNAFDSQGRQLQASVNQQTQLMSLLLDRTEKHHENSIREVTEYQRIIMQQQLELTEARIDMAYRDSAPLLTPEHVQALLPSLMQILTALAGKLTGAAAPGEVAAAAVEGAAAAAEIAETAAPG